jgi:hypothetical protein
LTLSIKAYFAISRDLILVVLLVLLKSTGMLDLPVECEKNQQEMNHIFFQKTIKIGGDHQVVKKSLH